MPGDVSTEMLESNVPSRHKKRSVMAFGDDPKRKFRDYYESKHGKPSMEEMKKASEHMPMMKKAKKVSRSRKVSAY